MTKPPIFGAEGYRWSLGSAVLVFHWEEREDGSVFEVEREGQVVAIRRGGEEGWIVSVSFGPAFDLLAGAPRELPPSRVFAAPK